MRLRAAERFGLHPFELDRMTAGEGGLVLAYERVRQQEEAGRDFGTGR